MRLNLVDVHEARRGASVSVDRLQNIGDGSLMGRRFEQAFERAKCRWVAGVVGEHVAIDLDGRLSRPHALLANFRETKQQHRLLVGLVGHRQLTFHVVREIAPQPTSGKEVVERAERSPIGRVEL